MDSLTAKEQQAKQVGWMDSILSLIPGRKQAASNEPSEEAIKRTHDYLRWGSLRLPYAHLWAFEGPVAVLSCIRALGLKFKAQETAHGN